MCGEVVKSSDTNYSSGRASTGATCLLDLCSTHGIWLCRVHALSRRERPQLNMLQLMQQQATRLLSQQTKKAQEHGAMPLLMQALQGTPSVQLNLYPLRPKQRQALHTCSAGAASGSMRTNHCSRTSGSTMSPPRCERGTRDACASVRMARPCACAVAPSLRTFGGRGDPFTAYCILSPASQVDSSAIEQRVKNHPQTGERHNRLSCAAPHALTGTPLCPPRCVRARQSGPAPHTRQHWRSACRRRS